MKRIYKLGEFDFTTTGPLKGLLTNGFGSYVALDTDLSYQGWYVLYPSQWRMQKIIESITPQHQGEQTTLYHHGHSLRRRFSKGGFDAFTPYQKTLLYETHNIKEDILLTLDHRESYDDSELGRLYTIDIQKDFVLISFKKQGEQGKEYDHYIGIKGVTNVKVLNSWREVDYAEDKKRGTPSTYWVYDALTFTSRGHVVFSSADSPSEARTIADISYYHFADISGNIAVAHQEKNIVLANIPDTTLRAGYAVATQSLHSLHQQFSFGHRLVPGIYAGLPWFFQLWTRDELISLGGLLTIAQETNNDALFKDIKKILARHIGSIQQDGLLPNRFPKSNLTSIDSIGWLAKRVLDFIQITAKQKKLYTLLSPEELYDWHKQLLHALERAKVKHQKNGLFYNDTNETWMDTSYEDDGRKGYRVEIQALFYTLYEAVVSLGKYLQVQGISSFEKEMNTFKKRIQQHFVNKEFEGRIQDGVGDSTYRPNIFLAVYIAPKLFSKKDLRIAIKKHLEELYLPWGAISSLSKHHRLFNPSYTGHDNKSYHRGDSWYFLNNITAQVLHTLDPQEYENEIQSILHASTKDLLEQGFMGHASEVSSALHQDANGCQAQSWSVSSYLEFVSFYFSDL